MKVCRKCKVEKSRSEFYVSRPNKDGLHAWCKMCCSAYAKSRTRPARTKESTRIHYLKSFYGITPEEFDMLLASQGGTCAACDARPDASTRNFHVDHDHSCCPGKRSCGRCIRGILCQWCNAALGQVRDSVERLKSLQNYLETTCQMNQDMVQ